MKTKTIVLWVITVFLIFIGAWPIGLLTLLIAIIVAIKEKAKAKQNSQEAEEIERQRQRQREIEKKEIDMVRKSNEILLHLIQDEHREGDR